MTAVLARYITAPIFNSLDLGFSWVTAKRLSRLGKAPPLVQLSERVFGFERDAFFAWLASREVSQ